MAQVFSREKSAFIIGPLLMTVTVPSGFGSLLFHFRLETVQPKHHFVDA
jgi:hypothetical protein